MNSQETSVPLICLRCGWMVAMPHSLASLEPHCGRCFGTEAKAILLEAHQPMKHFPPWQKPPMVVQA